MANKIEITKKGASTICKTYDSAYPERSIINSYAGNHNVSAVNDNIVIDSLQIVFALDSVIPEFVGTTEDFINSLAEDLKFTDAVAV